MVGLDFDFCLVVHDYGHHGIAFPETALACATFDATVRDILDAQLENVVAVVEFNPVEGLAREITEDVARKVAEIARQSGECPTPAVRRFLDRNGVDFGTDKDAMSGAAWE